MLRCHGTQSHEQTERETQPLAGTERLLLGVQVTQSTQALQLVLSWDPMWDVHPCVFQQFPSF